MQSFDVFILVYRNFILSFHYLMSPHFPAVIRRLDQMVSHIPITPHWINYAIVDDITDKFVPVISTIELEVDAIDDLVLMIDETEQSDMLRRIANARKRVMNLQRLLVTKAEVMKTLIKRVGEWVTTADIGRETFLYVGDVQDHVITMVQTLTHANATLDRCHSNYLAQINIDITQSSNRTNDVVARLTALASIIVPLNLITGLWGK